MDGKPTTPHHKVRAVTVLSRLATGGDAKRKCCTTQPEKKRERLQLSREFGSCQHFSIAKQLITEWRSYQLGPACIMVWIAYTLLILRDQALLAGIPVPGVPCTAKDECEERPLPIRRPGLSFW